MYTTKCPVCGSSHVQKNGKRKRIQLYICRDCHYQFRNIHQPTEEQLWQHYLQEKQTVEELAKRFHTSTSTVKRRLHNVSKVWCQPALAGSDYVHLDATYWGRNWGIILATDESQGYPLYMSFIKSETTSDYETAVASIEERGYKIRGIIIDGKQSLFSLFSAYKIQMCQFHMKQIIRRYLTQNPRLRAACALQKMMEELTKARKEDFERDYAQWKLTWHDVLYKKSTLKSGKMRYTHRRLRSAMHSIDFYLPYLFTYQEPDCEGMPNTNNKIEGTFTILKRKLNNHCGMSEENRKRFIIGFFLALEEKLRTEKQETI